MTREEAIHELSTIFGYGFYNERVDEALNMAIEALQQQPKWIPVTERLPEKGEIVLTTNTLWNVRSISIDWRNDEQWVRNGQYVIAWQPLPEPYKESDEDGSN